MWQFGNLKRNSFINIPCVKTFRIKNFSVLYFPSYGLNTEICFVNLHIHSESGKIQTKKTPSMYTFYAVISMKMGVVKVECIVLKIYGQWCLISRREIGPFLYLKETENTLREILLVKLQVTSLHFFFSKERCSTSLFSICFRAIILRNMFQSWFYHSTIFIIPKK